MVVPALWLHWNLAVIYSIVARHMHVNWMITMWYAMAEYPTSLSSYIEIPRSCLVLAPIHDQKL